MFFPSLILFFFLEKIKIKEADIIFNVISKEIKLELRKLKICWKKIFYCSLKSNIGVYDHWNLGCYNRLKPLLQLKKKMSSYKNDNRCNKVFFLKKKKINLVLSCNSRRWGYRLNFISIKWWKVHIHMTYFIFGIVFARHATWQTKDILLKWKYSVSATHPQRKCISLIILSSVRLIHTHTAWKFSSKMKLKRNE